MTSTENVKILTLSYKFQNLKTFCCVFIAFLESVLNLQRFQKKIELHSLSISEIIDSERRGYLNA